jgi:hypothetical protein
LEYYVDIVAGDSERPVSELFGVSWVLDFGVSRNAVEALEVGGGPFLGGDALRYSRIDTEAGTVGFGMTRKYGQAGASGSGLLARVRVKAHPSTGVISFTLRDVTANDAKGNAVWFEGAVREDSVGAESGTRTPGGYVLYQNHPNPFNPTTRIRYALPQAGDVELRVYDGLGRVVATLAEGRREAGEHDVEFDAKGLPSGLYTYRLQAGDAVITKKLLLLR